MRAPAGRHPGRTRPASAAGALAVAWLAGWATAAPAPASNADYCHVTDEAWLSAHAAKTFAVKGRYSWDIHGGFFVPGGCADAQLIQLNPAASAKIHRFVVSAYPGVHVIGGQVWGVFTLAIGDGDTPAAVITDVRIDPRRRMSPADPSP